jgi:hypothetical protein
MIPAEQRYDVALAIGISRHVGVADDVCGVFVVPGVADEMAHVVEERRSFQQFAGTRR